MAIEKVVGANIVNRFPLVIAASFCRESLSPRHYPRSRFMEILEASGHAAFQFLPPGEALDGVMRAIADIPDNEADSRLNRCGQRVLAGDVDRAPQLAEAHLVYETRLVRPTRGFNGETLYPQPWRDVGSHRLYFFEVTAIRLREDIAKGETQILWRSLSAWGGGLVAREEVLEEIHFRDDKYWKAFRPDYSFPTAGTVAFEYDEIDAGMAVKRIDSLPENQVEMDDDRARWPCFFPSSLGLVTSTVPGGGCNLMPCGSTQIIGRHPMTVAIAIADADFNQRYARRASLEFILEAGRFGVGVAFIDQLLLKAVAHTGNVSYREDQHKVARAKLGMIDREASPLIDGIPVHFDCRVSGTVFLGSHTLVLGEVTAILARQDLTPKQALEWCPWADVPAQQEA